MVLGWICVIYIYKVQIYIVKTYTFIEKVFWTRGTVSERLLCMIMPADYMSANLLWCVSYLHVVYPYKLNAWLWRSVAKNENWTNQQFSFDNRQYCHLNQNTKGTESALFMFGSEKIIKSFFHKFYLPV